MSIEALLSRGDGTDERVDLASWNRERLRPDELLWIDVMGMDADETDLLGRALGLSDSAAEALRGEVEDPGATVLDGAVEIRVLSVSAEDETPAAMRILVGSGWIVTQHRRVIEMLDERRERITDQREIGLLSPVEFLVTILGWHVDSFFRTAEQLELEVDRLDDAALRGEEDMLRQLVAMRRRIARCRRVAGLHREVFAELARPDFLPDLDDRESTALALVTDRLDRAYDALSNAREMLIGSFDVHMTRTAQRTNDIMRILTWASVILLPAVVIAGIMGMNFKVGFFDNPNVFFVVVGLMLALAVVTLLVARWRGWL
ncbi:MAG TPA: CorA family divalent cation transporter [Candidatus Limnocylindria bacterium]|nr:CorA family divalent cation transporter [Candidatus Limnocylindria bacterium]